jgi:hypothetical protein
MYDGSEGLSIALSQDMKIGLNPVRSDEIGIVPTESSNADVVLVDTKFGIPSRYSSVSTQKLHVHSYNPALVRLNQPVEGRFGCCTSNGTGCPGC